MTTRDLRVCFVGDSYVAGVGDPEHLGWAGLLAARTHHEELPLTAYVLGVRGDTSRDVLARFTSECTPRLPPGCDARVVISFGVNDTAVLDGRPRVAPEESVHNLRSLVTESARLGWQPLVVGPPPLPDETRLLALQELDRRLTTACAAVGVAYCSVLGPLSYDEHWMREVAAGDGAHPGSAGYAALAELVRPAWSRWLLATDSRQD